MIHQKPQHFFGFTLVELLVSIAILLIIATVIFQGFMQYANVQRYEAIVSEIRNDIATQRTKTLASYDDTVYGVYVGSTTIEFFSGAIPVVGSSNNKIITLAGYRVTATSSFSNGNRYTTFSRLTGFPTATGTVTIFDTLRSASTTFTFLESGIIQ